MPPKDQIKETNGEEPDNESPLQGHLVSLLF